MNEIRNNNFLVTFQKLPSVAYYANDIPIPAMALGEAPVYTRTLDFALPGDKIQFDPITITFNVDEHLENYMEVYNWMMELGHPDRSKITRPEDKDAVSDGIITVLNNNKNPIYNIILKDCFPISLVELAMNIQASEPVICTITMKYSWFEINSLST